MDDIKVGPAIPAHLQHRVNQIVRIDDILDGKTASPNESVDENASQTQIDQAIVEPRLNPKPLNFVETNWIEKYCGTNRKERIKWKSKVYKYKSDFKKMTMHEQIEELMDVSAESFADCINKLSDNEQHQINKETIKKLFSIEAETDVAHSLLVHSVQKPVVSGPIAELFNCPELFIEKNVEALLKEDQKKASKIVPKWHAFGRSLSPASKRRIAAQLDEEDPFDFPEDIRSGEILFHGIDHLKSVKALMKCLDENNLPQPKYLVEMNALDVKSVSSQHVPLHTFYQ